MKKARVYAVLPGGHKLVTVVSLSASEVAAFANHPEVGERMARDLIAMLLRRNALILDAGLSLDDAFESWGVSLFDAATTDQPDVAPASPPSPRLARCRSLLGLASGLLPASEREDAFDEWADEVETAAAEGRPILRRTCSIVARSLPVMILRSRLPKRAPRGGG